MKYWLKNNKIRVSVDLVCGLIIWHVVHRHVTGMYQEMFGWKGTGKTYIAVLYNLGLMLAMGTTLGLLMKKIPDLLGYEVCEIKHFSGEETAHNK